MGINTKSAQYQADRNAFNQLHKSTGNGSFPSMRTAELEALARQGNLYARHQLNNQRRADMAVSGDEGKVAQMDGEAWGKLGDTLEKVSDSTTMGAHRNIRESWDKAVEGRYTDSGKQMLKAGGKIGASAVKAFVMDKATGCVFGKAGKFLAGASQATVRTLGEFANKHSETLLTVQGMTNDYLSPALENTLSITH